MDIEGIIKFWKLSDIMQGRCYKFQDRVYEEWKGGL